MNWVRRIYGWTRSRSMALNFERFAKARRTSRTAMFFFHSRAFWLFLHQHPKHAVPRELWRCEILSVLLFGRMDPKIHRAYELRVSRCSNANLRSAFPFSHLQRKAVKPPLVQSILSRVTAWWSMCCVKWLLSYSSMMEALEYSLRPLAEAAHTS